MSCCWQAFLKPLGARPQRQKHKQKQESMSCILEASENRKVDFKSTPQAPGCPSWHKKLKESCMQHSGGVLLEKMDKVRWAGRVPNQPAPVFLQNAPSCLVNASLLSIPPPSKLFLTSGPWYMLLPLESIFLPPQIAPGHLLTFFGPLFSLREVLLTY